MSSPLFLFSLAYGLLMFGLATLDGRLVALALPLLAYLGVAVYRSPRPPRLRASRELSAGFVIEGGVVQARLALLNEGPGIEELLVEDQPPSPLALRSGETRRVAVLAPGAALDLRYSVSGRRGVFEFPQLYVSAGETFGLFHQRLELPVHSRLVVLPAGRPLRQIAIRPLRTLGFAGFIPSRQSGAGVDFFGVREYQPGDSLRRVNWRATARHANKPFSTEFEQERIADVGLILDMRRGNALEMGGHSLLEHSIRAVSALSDALLRDGHRVGLLLYGRGLEWVFPGYGKGQRERILQALAAVQPTGSEVFESLNYLPTRVFPARSQLVFVSPLSSADQAMLFRLRAFGYSVLVISPDPVSFAAAALPAEPHLPLATRLARLERQLFLNKLRQGGVVVVDWAVDKALDEVVVAALGRWAHTAHGRGLHSLAPRQARR